MSVVEFLMRKFQNVIHQETVLCLLYITSLLLLFSVLTPYYSEETVYSKNDIEVENEDGVSIIYYLQKIFPGL